MVKLQPYRPLNKTIAGLLVVGAVVLGYITYGAMAAPSPTVGPDTSNWQPYINTSLAYNDGYRFQIAKATEGLGYQDPTFGTSLADDKIGGLIPGAYHFLHNGSGAAQADYFINDVKSHNGGSTKGVMYMLDVETYGSAHPTYADVNAFVARFKQLVPNRTLIIYTGTWFWGDKYSAGYLGNPQAPSGTVLDVSMYVTCSGSAWAILNCVTPQGSAGEPYAAAPINGWPKYFFRQYTDNAGFANINTDGNVSYMGRNALLALAGLTTTPAPTPTPTPKPSATATPKPTGTATPKPTPKPTPAPTNPYSCSTHPTLSEGANSTCVKRVQWFLNSKGGAGLTIDGAFGSGTYSAVRTWQSRHSLTVDGVVGALTWATLEP